MAARTSVTLLRVVIAAAVIAVAGPAAANAAPPANNLSIRQQLTDFASAPSFAADSAPAAPNGIPYSYTYTATGAGSFSVVSGSLPPGLLLDGSTGVLSGTPTTNGNYTFTVEATNASGSTVGSTQMVTVADPGSTTFGFTGGEQTFVVPAGDTEISVSAVGAPGGSAPGIAGGFGAQLSTDLAVTPGETLYVEVGGPGAASAATGAVGAGGFNGGGVGGAAASFFFDSGGGGGGASDIRTTPLALNDLDSRLVVAGGGGGDPDNCSATAGGSAGPGDEQGYVDSAGEDGPNCGADEFGDGGAGGVTTTFSFSGDTVDAGGGAGGGTNNTDCGGSGSAGALGTGGAGENGANHDSGGGGGGGGYYGGGGGGQGCAFSAGGGGAGSSFSAGTNTSVVTAGVGGSFDATPAITIGYGLEPQSISFPDTSVTYGQADFSPASASSGLPVTYSDPSGDCSVVSGLVHITGAGSCTVTASQAGNADFSEATPVTQTLAVNQAVVHVDADVASVTYGQPDPTATGTLRASDFQFSDTASTSGITGSASCTIATHSPDAGTYSGVVTCGPGTLSSANYTFAAGSAADLTINQAVVHVDADPASVAYGQPDPTVSGTLRASDFQFSDTALTSGITGSANCTIATHSPDAGAYTGVVTCGPGTLRSTNYTFAAGSAADLTINQAVVHVDANPGSVTYGQPDPTATGTLRASDFQLSDTASSSGITGSPSCQISTHSPDAGTYSGVVTCGPGTLSSTNYTFTAGSVADLTINQAVVHVDADPASVTYGQPDPTATGTLRASDFEFADTASTSGITGSASCTIADHSPDAGMYSGVVMCGPGTLSSANYTFAAGSAADLTVNQAVVHVDADPASITYGQPDPTPTGILRASDFQNSDTALNSGITGAASCQISTHSPDAGTYSGVVTCGPGTLSSANYTFAAGSAADLTVNQAVVHVDADPASITYGQPDPTATGTLRASDFQDSDTASSSGIAGSPSCAIATHSPDAGTYSGVITCGPGTLSSTNYTFAAGSAADLTINQAVVHVDADPASVTYGQPDPTATGTLRASDFQNSDTALNSGITGSAACQISTHSPDAGTYTGVITCGPGSLSSANYTFAAGSAANLTIAQAPQSIAFTSSPPDNAMVGGSYTVAATATSGLQISFSTDASSGNGVCSVSGALVSFTGAGSCVIDATQTGNGNYHGAAPVQQTIDVGHVKGTATALSSSADPSVVGEHVIYSATVRPTPDGGSVRFVQDGKTIPGCDSVTVSTRTGTASCQTSYATVASHAVQATYSGDPDFAGSHSSSLKQAVHLSVALHGSPSGKLGVASFSVTCARGSGGCKISGALTSVETTKGNKILAVTASAEHTQRTVAVGASTVKLAPGRTATVKIPLNTTGRRLLANFKKLPATLTISLTAGGQRIVVAVTRLTITRSPVH